jgi:hypothetical protein
VPEAGLPGTRVDLTFGRPPHRQLWRGCAALMAGGKALPGVVCGSADGDRIRLGGGYSPLRQGVAVSEGEELGSNQWPKFGSVARTSMGVTGLEPVTSSLSSWRSPN